MTLLVTLSFDHLAQCVIEGPFPIPDNNETEISIVVEGLTFGTLDHPLQGLCGVRVRFNHSHVGDLELSLRSPSGDIVELTGPLANTGPTSFTVWDVTFLPCADPVAPDPGFMDQWDNDQAWASLANYNGTYWPYQGCLEDLTGSANGLWTLFAADGQPIDEGVVQEVELIFCNTDGLSCTECEANAGSLDLDTVYQCVNAQHVELELDPEYVGNPPGPDYSTFYVVTRNGNMYEVTSDFDTEDLDVGLYTICPLSVQHSDTFLIQVYPPGVNTIEDYEEYLLNREICFSLGDDCSILEVSNPLPPDFRVETICSGDTLYWIDTFFYAAGSYNFIDTGYNGCLRTFSLSLSVIDPAPGISVDTAYDCDQHIATLTGMDSTYTGMVTFQWSTTGGTILTSRDSQTVRVSGTGRFILATTYESMGRSCTDTIGIELVDDYRIPMVSYIGDSLTCDTDSTEMTSIVTPVNSTIIWRGPLGEEDTASSHVIYDGEQYTLIAVSNLGCRDSIDVVLSYDTLGPMPVLSPIDKLCRDDSVMISPGIIDTALTYFWVDPSLDTIRQSEFLSDETGIFRLYVTGDNGCTGVSELFVSHVGTTPEFTIRSDTIFCLTDSVFLQVSSNLDVLSYEITGPSNFLATDSQTYIYEAGDYLIRVETTDGCMYDTLWQPPLVMDITDVVISGDSLNCVIDSVDLIPVLPVGNYDYSWQGPGGFNSDLETVRVGLSGTYDLEVITGSGCVLEGSYFVGADTVPPQLGIVAGVLDCATDSVQLQLAGMQTGLVYSWFGPGGFMSDLAEPMVGLPGAYQLIATGPNGCTNGFQHDVMSDYIPPAFQLDTTPFQCDTNWSVALVTTDAVFVEWTGSGFLSNDTLVRLPAIQEYDLYLLGANGCDTTITFVPPVDTAAPVVGIFSDTLGCNRDTVSLYLISDVLIETIQWSGPVTDDSANPTYTSESGIYDVTLTAFNGCATDTSIEVVEDFSVPDLTITGQDTLNCLLDSVRLTIEGDYSDLALTWIAPDLSTSSDTFYDATIPGTYSLVAEAPNSCLDTSFFDVVEDTTFVDLSLDADTINCVQNSAVVSANVGTDEMIEWLWPNNITSGQASFITFVPGEYRAVKWNVNSGCSDTAYIEVVVDTAQINNGISGDTVISCERPSLVLYSDIPHNMSDLAWQGPGVNEVGVDSIIVTEPGIYTLISIASSLCSDLDTISITVDTMAPDFDLISDTITCGESVVQLGVVGDTTDAIFSWTGPGQFSSDRAMPEVSIPGTYRLQVEGVNGCVFADSVEVFADTLIPEIFIPDTLLSCPDSTVTVEVLTLDSIDVFEWYLSGVLVGVGRQITLDSPGEYIVVGRTADGCEGIDSFTVQYDQMEEVDLFIDSISCNHSQATHSIVTIADQPIYTWMEGGVIVGQMTDLMSSSTGPFTVLVENERGCLWDSTFTVVADTQPPMPIITQTTEIGCMDSDADLVLTNVDTTDATTYDWSVINGMILSPTDRPVITVSLGEYAVVTRDETNGCSGTDTVRVEESPDNLRIEDISIQQPNCLNDFQASITIVSVANAVGDVMYFLNDFVRPDSIFSNLAGGIYVVEVVDETGCSDSDTISINNSDPVYVEAYQDTTVELGAEVYLTSENNIESNTIESQWWSFMSDTLCSACPDLFYTPAQSGFYTVSVRDTNGCLVRDSVLIDVLITSQFYVPNAFSPNDDGINDEVGPYTGTNVASVVDFAIFSRWGECVHRRENLAPDDTNLFWDGHFRGQLMDPGVFVYRISVELIDGTVAQRKGEIHLIR